MTLQSLLCFFKVVPVMAHTHRASDAKLLTDNLSCNPWGPGTVGVHMRSLDLNPYLAGFGLYILSLAPENPQASLQSGLTLSPGIRTPPPSLLPPLLTCLFWMVKFMRPAWW